MVNCLFESCPGIINTEPLKVRTNCNSPQQILKEIDEDFTDDEIDEVIAEVRKQPEKIYHFNRTS